MRLIFSVIMVLLGPGILLPAVPYWSCYGGDNIEWVLSSEDAKAGANSAKMADPSSSTYKILYQSVAIASNKHYSAEVWVKNIDYTSSDYVKLRLGVNHDDSWLGNSFKTYLQANTTILGTWVLLRVNNIAASNTNHFAKVGLYVHYPSAGSYKAYWDNARLFSTDNTNVNLLQNGDFETLTGPSGSSSGDTLDVNQPPLEQFLKLDRRIFSAIDKEQVKIDFQVPFRNSDILIRVFDMKGGQVRDLFQYLQLSDPFPAGSGTVSWDGRDDLGRRVRTGTYFIYLEATNYMTGRVTRMKQMVVVGRRL